MGESQFIPELNYTAAYPDRSMLIVISETCNGATGVSRNSPNAVLRYYADMSKLADLLKQFHYSWRDVLRTHC